MRNKILLFALMIIGANQFAFAQELYIFTEPASNMSAKSVALRLTNEGSFIPEFRSRTIGEAMIGINKNIMFHVQGFLSDLDGSYKLEGASVYAKYRFLSLDNAQSHFRAAAFGRVSTSNRPGIIEDINLEGDNSGWQGGLVFTQLLHKLALSATVGYSKSLNSNIKELQETDQKLNYSLSSGYLLLPFVYKNYNQPNFNLYFEILGNTNPVSGRSYTDFAPAVQLILNSKTRIDIGYRFQVAGNMTNRYLKNMYLVRAEFNFFNALSKKS